MAGKMELISSTPNQLGEGPQWLPDSKQLLWVDIEGKTVHLYNHVTKQQRAIQVDQRIGAVIPAKDGNLICALEDGIYKLYTATEQLTRLTALEAELPDNRCNDGKCDASGRLWIGTMPMRGEPWKGSLYSYNENGELKQHLTDIGCSNGLDWSLDGRTMYYIDTPTKRVDQLDFDIETGQISNRRPLIHIPEGKGSPDGMCVDSEGYLWIAHWGGSCLTCWDPETGQCVTEIAMPVSQVTSCCFGGDNLDILFVTSARVGLSEERLKQEPLAGSVFAIEMNRTGRRTHLFGGN